MSKMTPHTTYADRDDLGLESIPPTIPIARIHPASKKAVKLVLDATTDGNNGRSNWVWVRLVNGDLLLGVFPQGDTYFEVEKDAEYPEPKVKK